MNDHGTARFPKGFLWGSATAAYQVEGGIEDVDWAEAARAGKVPAAGRACEHFSRYEQDFDVAASLGQNAHRFSVEWARIEPEEGKFDEAAIEHYRKVIAALRARGLEPFVTLWHFTLPLWFSKSGGFERHDAPAIFARYCAFVAGKLGTDSSGARFWMTINEPMVWANNGYLRGRWPPFHRHPLRYVAVTNALARAHNAAYAAMKQANPSLQIGIAKNNMFVESNGAPWNRIAAAAFDWFWNFRFLNKIAKHQDFIGLNQYFHKKFGRTAGERAAAARSEAVSDMGWEIYPESLYHSLMALRKYGVPLYVTENGIADAADSKRTAFIEQSAAAAARAIAEGADLRGYFYWSLLDNFEWAEGFTKRFGLVEVDYATMRRTVRASAKAYEKICRAAPSLKD